MALGISTACLYPMAMEDSLQTLIDSGFREFEIFINTYSEMEPEFLTMLEEKLKPQGCRVKSLHPFTSGFESYLCFPITSGGFRMALPFTAGILKWPGGWERKS